MVILGQKGQFRPVFGQCGQNGENYQQQKKTLGTFFSHLQALTNCKVSEKLMNGFREKALHTDSQTHGRTNRWTNG